MHFLWLFSHFYKLSAIVLVYGAVAWHCNMRFRFNPAKSRQNEWRQEEKNWNALTSFVRWYLFERCLAPPLQLCTDIKFKTRAKHYDYNSTCANQRTHRWQILPNQKNFFNNNLLFHLYTNTHIYTIHISKSTTFSLCMCVFCTYIWLVCIKCDGIRKNFVFINVLAIFGCGTKRWLTTNGGQRRRQWREIQTETRRKTRTNGIY